MGDEILSEGDIAAIVLCSLFAFIAVPIISYILLDMSTKKKILTFFKREALRNSLIILAFAVVASLFLAGVIEKWTGGPDNLVDFCKFFVVLSNIFILTLLLFQKNIFLGGTVLMQLSFASIIISLIVLALINLSILIIIGEQGYQDDTPLQGVPYNYDYLTLAATIVTDLSYLVVYIMFNARRAILAAVIIIIVEIVILSYSIHLGTDFAIDTTNLTLSFLSGTLAVIMWTAKVTLTKDGTPLEFKDFAMRDDLNDATDGLLLVPSEIPHSEVEV